MVVTRGEDEEGKGDKIYGDRALGGEHRIGYTDIVL